MSGIDDIIINTVNKDFSQANDEFNTIMQDKLNDRLDAQRALIAQQMAGNVSSADQEDDDAIITNDDIEDEEETPEVEEESEE